MKKFFMLLLALSPVLLTACQTMEGFGRDVQKVGSKVEEAARR
ncbi:MAG TPA: entericidin [Oxalobacteraceae bacterium]|nr:entericidin [Oxalobacteraceae bacterium]